MNYAEAVKRATASVLAPQIENVRKGTIPRDVHHASSGFDAEQYLAEQATRFRDQIAAETQRLLHPPEAPRCHCGRVATTAIAGDDYCDDHSATAPRLPRPKKLEVA
jgi:hypothetical protein